MKYVRTLWQGETIIITLYTVMLLWHALVAGFIEERFPSVLAVA
jgi:hypothetical protein